LGKPGAEEIIVVDDRSTDETLAGARQFESNEVRVVTQPNQMAAAARVPSAGDTANPDELKDGLGKYEHRKSYRTILRYAAALRAPHPAALNTHAFGLPVVATDVGSFRNDIMETKAGFLCRAKESGGSDKDDKDCSASDLDRNLERGGQFGRVCQRAKLSNKRAERHSG